MSPILHLEWGVIIRRQGYRGVLKEASCIVPSGTVFIEIVIFP